MLGHAHHRSLSQHNLHKASVILAPMSLCNPFLPSSAKRPLLLPFRAAAFVAPAFFSLPPPPVFSSFFFFLLFSSSSLHPLLIVSLLGSCSFFPFISLLSIIFKHPIFASILRSVLDVASTLYYISHQFPALVSPSFGRVLFTSLLVCTRHLFLLFHCFVTRFLEAK